MNENRILPMAEAPPPDNAMVHCPMHRFMLQRAQNCMVCAQFQGVARIAEAGDWVQQYRIVCGQPILRRCEEVNLS